MKTYDAYLKKRLTEIDIIISELVNRDIFLIRNKLYLICSSLDLEFTKNISSEFSLNLDTAIDEVIKMVHEILRHDMVLCGSAALSGMVFTGEEMQTILMTEKMDTCRCFCVDSGMDWEILVEPIDYYIGHSLGSSNIITTLNANQFNPLKTAFENVLYLIQPLSEAEFSSRKMTDINDIEMQLTLVPTNIFYQCQVSGGTEVCIEVESLIKYTLNPVLHELSSEMQILLSSIDENQATKFAETVILCDLLFDVNSSLIRMIEPEVETTLGCEMSIGLKRYRLLEDMDELSLDNFDDMSLNQIDYVVIAE